VLTAQAETDPERWDNSGPRSQRRMVLSACPEASELLSGAKANASTRECSRRGATAPALERLGRIARAITDPMRAGQRMLDGNKRNPWTSWLRRFLELPWAEMIGSVFCFHFALAETRVTVRIVLAAVGVILLVAAISNIVKKRKSTHS
jgi:hypothetical protein